MSGMERLKEIWRDSFGGEGVDFIFQRLLRPENMIVKRVNGEAVATLSVQEFRLGGCKAAYIFGVATAPEHRGRGYSTQLLEHADTALKDAGYAAAVLVPASKSLFGFYEKRGYETAFRLNKASVAAGDLPKSSRLEAKPASAETLTQAREMAFGHSGMFARWPLEYLRYIAEECGFYGGGVFSLGENVCAACYLFGETLAVKELAGASEDARLTEALAALKRKFPAARRFELYLREDIHTAYTNNLLPFGMIKWYDSVEKRRAESSGGLCYITHALD